MRQDRGKTSKSPWRRTVLGAAGGAVAAGLPFLPDPVAGVTAWLAALSLLLSLVVGYGLLRSIHSLGGGTWGSAFTTPPVAGRTYAAATGGFVVLLALARWVQSSAVPDSPFQSVWFAWPWWLLRAGLFPPLWGYLVYRGAPGSGETSAQRRGATVFLLVTVPTFWLAVVDGQMLFLPDWNSTLFPFYHLFAALPAAVATAGVLGVRVPSDHGGQTGRLAVFFTTLWVYLWFCQYLLVWYAGIPAESHYWLVRTSGGWESLTFAVPLVGWLLPFVLLLPVATRRRRSLTALAYSAILLGRWLDLYLVWQPQVRPSPWPWLFVDSLPALLLAWFVFGRTGSLGVAHVRLRRTPQYDENREVRS